MPDARRCHALLHKLSQMDPKWKGKQGKWAYDGQKILFTSEDFLPVDESEYIVRIPDPQQRSMQQSHNQEGPLAKRELEYKVRSWGVRLYSTVQSWGVRLYTVLYSHGV